MRWIKHPLSPLVALIVLLWLFLCLILSSCGSSTVSDSQITRRLNAREAQMRSYCEAKGMKPDVWIGTSNDGDITVYGRCK